MIPRLLTGLIKQRLAKEKAIILLGPRQVGKTTLLFGLLENDHNVLYLDCDEPDVRKRLTEPTSTELRNLFGDHHLVVIDEAQRIKNIGLTTKLIVDKLKKVKIILSGSSALELANTINEPLTGRKFEFLLLPFSTLELVNHFGRLETERQLEQRLIFGFYPDLVLHPSEARERLSELVTSYLYKDIFTYQDIRRPGLLPDLLEAIARQVGNEVSYHELASLLGVDGETVKRYIDLLEKSYVIFKLRSFSRNLRNELKKSIKIYFFDNGVRNAILGNYQPLELRTDIGALWENFFISERIKLHYFNRTEVKAYFWRTKQQQEIDYIEEINGKISVFECKWNPKSKTTFSSTFIREYSPKATHLVTRENYLEYLLSDTLASSTGAKEKN
ncbi:MAG: ATP-binding protein [Saprospiraceae bacterium]